MLFLDLFTMTVYVKYEYYLGDKKTWNGFVNIVEIEHLLIMSKCSISHNDLKVICYRGVNTHIYGVESLADFIWLTHSPLYYI